jgi:predicted Zn-dependent protease
MLGTGDSDCYGNVRALARRDFLWRWTRRLGWSLALLALAFGCHRGYGVLREKHLARQAQEFLTRGDQRSAVLAARRVLQLNEDNVAACRVMAEAAEIAGRGEALSWRQRVTMLEPNVPENMIARAGTALRFGQADLARRLLETIGSPTRSTVKYHQLAGALALAEKQPATAEEQFAAALALEPGNLRFALNLANVRLASPQPATQEKARVELVRLSEQPITRLESLRALVSDALAHDSREAAERFATQLKTEKDGNFSDALLFLEATHGRGPAMAALADVQARANQSPATAASLITWMNRHGLAKAAVEWGLSLPPPILAVQPVPLAIAESYSFLEDWGALRSWVEGKNWSDYECFRLAAQSHALHHLGPSDRPSMESETVWRAALKATQGRPARLAAIAQLAEGWGYTAEAAEAWWKIADGTDGAKEALAALQRLYKSKQDSHGLLRVAQRAFELNPADLVAANNCASLGLLLSGDSSARRLATKLHFEHPGNLVLNATYAFALHLEGKTGAALKVMETLKEAELSHPAVAAYYFVMLIENGNMERAHSFLSAANRAALLPEEQQLLTSATRKLLAHDSKNAAKSVAEAEPAIR